ncbi:MAG: DUF3419 family protein [Candidatus Aminicenantes bacterium]|nr:DUF3419 family protein [Candidatus Aminicenantes bacterium]
MASMSLKIQKFEFENRIFISFGFVLLVCGLSFSVFAAEPETAVLLGTALGIPARLSLAAGHLAAALLMAAASFLRIWAGSVLTSRRMMSFKVKTDAFCACGPYRLVRHPIYAADYVAFFGFALCLPPVGLLLPVFLFVHYTQLIRYEERSLLGEFGSAYAEYARRTPRLLPHLVRLPRLGEAFGEEGVTRDGLRHNALYLTFIPGFLLAALTGELAWAIILGVPAVVDWAVVHTKIGTAKEAAAPARKKKVFADILYANCWEDPRPDRLALAIGPEDTVLSITSGGCNVLTFLLDDPRRVIALDLNPHQNHLLELKMAAFRGLSHAGVLEFVGVRESSSRRRTYEQLRPALSQQAARFWDARERAIDRGVIHGGRYEGYMRLLRKSVVGPFGKTRLVREFFETADSAERARLFRERWNDLWWKLLTRVMLSRRVNSVLFDKAFFAHLDRDLSFGRHFAQKAERALVELPVQENYFLAYILLGRFASERHLPPYLREENFAPIRDRLDRVEVVTDSGEHFLSTLPDSSVSKFNFSNIFEWMSPAAYERFLRETVRVARDGARLVYRNLLVFREHPPSLDGVLHSQGRLAKSLQAEDLSFIYDNYVVEDVRKETRT